MGLHQGPEGFLFMRSNRSEDDLSQVQTQGLGKGDVEERYPFLVGRCPESRTTPCRDQQSWLGQLRPGW
jgi:hypothetical protein